MGHAEEAHHAVLRRGPEPKLLTDVLVSGDDDQHRDRSHDGRDEHRGRTDENADHAEDVERSARQEHVPDETESGQLKAQQEQPTTEAVDLAPPQRKAVETEVLLTTRAVGATTSGIARVRRGVKGGVHVGTFLIVGCVGICTEQRMNYTINKLKCQYLTDVI